MSGTLSTHSSLEVIAGTGVSYRQLDYWTRHGWITPTVAANGSGSYRRWAKADRQRLVRLGQLGQLVHLRGDLVAACWAADPAKPFLFERDGLALTLPPVVELVPA